MSSHRRDAVPGCKVDLAILNRADPLFLKKIVESCRVLFGMNHIQRFIEKLP